MTPILSNILVKPFPPEEISEGGIFVPDSAKAVNNKVRIVKVGNGTKTKPMLLKEGQTGHVVKDWCKVGGTEIIYEGESHFLIDQSSIIALE